MISIDVRDSNLLASRNILCLCCDDDLGDEVIKVPSMLCLGGVIVSNSLDVIFCCSIELSPTVTSALVSV